MSVTTTTMSDAAFAESLKARVKCLEIAHARVGFDFRDTTPTVLAVYRQLVAEVLPGAEKGNSDD